MHALPGDLWRMTLRSKAEFDTLGQANAELLAKRRAFEATLSRALPEGQSAKLPGYCAVCARDTDFVYDHCYAAAGGVNWRERLLCANCGLNNRQRLALHLLSQHGPANRAQIYVTEQTTQTAQALSKRYKHVVGSEYLGPKWQGGQYNAQGLRHEDVTRLSFSPDQFDWVLSFDVLEHVPDYRAALREFLRVIKGNGRLLLTVPQNLGSEKNITRAEFDDYGRLTHILPPEYHGDPVNPELGILCYYHFGWELLPDLIKAGFDDALVILSYSRKYGYIGYEQAVVMAIKSSGSAS